MAGWMLLWKATFVFAIAIFSVMAVWVTIGGFQDLLRLIQRLKEAGDDE